MPKGPDFAPTFAILKRVLKPHAAKLRVLTDEPGEFTLVGTVPSPYPQHKGKPMYFAMLKTGKAYVSFHLLPIYMDAKLSGRISPALKKRMQGKACFNFKTEPEPDVLSELKDLIQTSLDAWKEKKWLEA